ncbi:MAG: hypothetical protein ACREC0_03015 [Methylocella sp.]
MSTMNMPGFTAEASLYPTSGFYYWGKALTDTAFATELIPAAFNLGSFGYNCDSESGNCRCTGIWDCLNMIIFGNVCGGILVCGANGCACDWRHM